MLLICSILIGIILGILVPFNIPSALAPFAAVGLLAACNTLFGGLYAQMRKKFDARAFISGFFFNTIFAILLTYLGSKLGVDFSLAAIVYFGTRIFNNLAKIQHYILQKQGERVKIKRIRDNRVETIQERYQTLRTEEDEDA